LVLARDYTALHRKGRKVLAAINRDLRAVASRIVQLQRRTTWSLTIHQTQSSESAK